MKKSIDIGIDLGTTNSSIARFADGVLNIYKNFSTQKETTASVVAFRKERVVIGDKAKEFQKRSSNNVFSHFKRKMGTNHTYFVASRNEFVTPVDLSKYILMELSKFVPSTVNKDAVVITIPASFDTIQSNATKTAGYNSGFKEVILLQEPIAASIAYVNKSGQSLESKTWIVYDLGGGTFDVALIKIIDGEMKIVDHIGDNYLGGMDFDELIIKEIFLERIKLIKGYENILTEINDIDSDNGMFYQRLMYLAEEVKKELSTSEIVEVDIDLKEEDLFLEINRREFENLIEPVLKRTIEMTRKMLVANHITDLDHIFLVGGSTYIPLVKEKLRNEFEVKVDDSIDPITAVVNGAAYYANSKLYNVGLNVEEKQNRPFFKEKEKIEIELAYHAFESEMISLLLVRSKGKTKEIKVRFMRSDGGYDSGYINLEGTLDLTVNLIANTSNTFKMRVYDKNNNEIEELIQEFTINQGKYTVQGQPLPHDICIELDSPEDSKSFLEPIFKKNAILPLNKFMIRQVAQNVKRGSSDSLQIKIFEGSHHNLPSASILIGSVKIEGTDLERDIIEGVDIELNFSMSESRDLSIEVYIPMIDTEIKEVFKPNSNTVDANITLNDIKDLKRILTKEVSVSERTQNFERAQILNSYILELNTLKEELLMISGNDNWNKKLKIDIRKRELARKIGETEEKSLLTKLVSDFYSELNSFKNILNSKESNDSDKEFYKAIKEEGDSIVKEGSILKLKIVLEKLDVRKKHIFQRREMTFTEYTFLFYYYDSLNYINIGLADQLREKGREAIQTNNQGGLVYAIVQLDKLYTSENPKVESEYSLRTGLK